MAEKFDLSPPPPETPEQTIARLELELERWESWAAKLPLIFAYRPDAAMTDRHMLETLGIELTPVNVAACWALGHVHPGSSWNDHKARVAEAFGLGIKAGASKDGGANG